LASSPITYTARQKHSGRIARKNHFANSVANSNLNTPLIKYRPENEEESIERFRDLQRQISANYIEKAYGGNKSTSPRKSKARISAIEATD
jgi:hypothetical protein